MREQIVEIPAASATLAGTLTWPDVDDHPPAALLLNGSGPLDRDSAMPGMTLGLGPALTGLGFALLRYDKRGVGASEGDYLSTSFSQECDDALAALNALYALPGVDPKRVFVIGHSTGALVAARMVHAGTPPAGYVLLGCAVRPGAEVMAWQSERIAATLPRLLRPLGPVLTFTQRRERARIAASTADRHDKMPRSRLTDYWLREYMTVEPSWYLAGIDKPVLALTGGKDIQVDPDDVARIGRLVKGPFDGEVPPDLTHLLRQDSGPPGILRYRAQLARPVDRWVTERIAAWARRTFP